MIFVETSVQILKKTDTPQIIISWNFKSKRGKMGFQKIVKIEIIYKLQRLWSPHKGFFKYVIYELLVIFNTSIK